MHACKLMHAYVHVSTRMYVSCMRLYGRACWGWGLRETDLGSQCLAQLAGWDATFAAEMGCWQPQGRSPQLLPFPSEINRAVRPPDLTWGAGHDRGARATPPSLCTIQEGRRPGSPWSLLWLLPTDGQALNSGSSLLAPGVTASPRGSRDFLDTRGLRLLFFLCPLSERDPQSLLLALGGKDFWPSHPLFLKPIS